jgi:6-phospho 3-hexuloisomerase
MMPSTVLGRQALTVMADHARQVAQKISDQDISACVEAINKANRVYMVGTGKTGLVAKSFAMSLLTAEKEAFMVGESLMPSPSPHDLIIAVSGSGESSYPLKTAKLGKQLGAKIIAITSEASSPLANTADHIICIEGRKPGDTDPDYLRQQLDGSSGGLLGALFEVAVMLFFNAIATILQDTNKPGA